MRIAAAALAALLAVLVVPVGAAAQNGSPAVVVSSVSNRADLVSGGDVLVDVTVPVDATDVAVRVDDRDVSDVFVRVDDRTLRGLVAGLPLGTSTVGAVLADGRGARLEVINHPIGGPVFAGPQVQPWLCDTETAGLGPATDEQCNAPTVVSFLYQSAVTQQFADYDPEEPPSDVATTTTDEGVTVPYVVRVETGTIDRGIFQTAVLADPAAPWTAVAPQETWNGKVVHTFGGGTGPDHTQALPGGLLVDSALSRGFLVATSSLNVHGQNANDTVAAEAVMMLLEHVVETYGPIRHTIGTGCSGGGLQQYIIADTYPGLLDGLIPNCSYPDIWTTAMEVADCVLLNHYFEETSPALWAVAQQRAFVAGHQEIGSCKAWELLFGPRFEADLASNCALPEEVVYDPETNPTGTRCTLNDYQVAIWGPRDRDEWGPVEEGIDRGFAARPVSNVGVQYGLDALEAGLVTAEQFVDLNAQVGGADIDGVLVPGRTAASAGASATAYRTGQVVLGHELDRVPIIDLRGHDNTEIHTDVYSQVTAARLVAANGHADNQAVWTGAIPLVGEPEWVTCGESIANGTGGGQELPNVPIPCSDDSPLLLMDRWLTDIEADTSATPLEEKVLANRPEPAVDSCFVGGHQVTDEAACAAAYPVFRTTRMVAGGPLANDVIDCALAPLDRESYAVAFTDGQWDRLVAAFPDGVCDYDARGTGHQPPVATWLSFPGDGAAPVPLGAAPTSVPFGPAARPAPSEVGSGTDDPAAPESVPPTAPPAAGATPAAASDAALPTTGGTVPVWSAVLLAGVGLLLVVRRRHE